MGEIYLVTGATSYPGINLVRALSERGASVRALVMEGDPLEKELPGDVAVYHGNVTERATMEEFFDTGSDEAYVVHLAGIVTLNEEYNRKVFDVNVGGTRNVIDLCRDRGARKLVYISSSSAIPLLPKGKVMSEVSVFDPKRVRGCYAQSKAEATALVLEAAGQGLDASVIHPTAVFGPGCYGKSNLIDVLVAVYKGKLQVAVSGGADFIDVRDLAEMIISCCRNGRRGECYIAGGQYYTVRELIRCIRETSGRGRCWFTVPAWLLKAIAPVSERISRKLGHVPFLTSFSMYQLTCNMIFSTEKAKRELGLRVRPFVETVRDTIGFLKQEGRI